MYNLNDKIHRYWTEGMDDTRVEYRFDYSACEKCGLKDRLQKESALLKETRDRLIESQKMHKRCADNAVKIIRHHKYKRCLDKAEMCKAKYDEEDVRVNWHYSSWEYTSEEMKYWERWERRWLELAEQFKEA